MRIVLMGAGGFALELLDLVETLGYEVVAVFDERGATDRPALAELGVTHTLDGVDADAAAIAVGDPATRRRFFLMARDRFALPTLVHPSACVSGRAALGEGCAVMQNVVVNAEASIGDGVLLNVGLCVGHECTVGSFCHLAPAVQLSGCSSVGEATMLGTMTTVLPGVSVGSGSVCGAGSVVTRDVADAVLVAGVPAKLVRSLIPEKPA